MKRKRRIFKPKRHYKIKRRSDTAVKIISGAIALAALVFVGYSVAGPVSRYLASRPERTESEPWSPSDTDLSVSETLPEFIYDSSDIAVTAPAETVSPIRKEEETSAPVPEAPAIREGGAAYIIDAEAMKDAETLGAELDDLQNSGCSAVIFPMKTQGGYFNYATNTDLPKTVTDGSAPILSSLTAEDIANAAKSRGLRPAALISVLYDNNRYGDYRDGAYRSEDDDTWLDAAPDKGGKPWLDPFDTTARKYVCDIVEELAKAGFKEIICDDFIFPEFRSSDVDMLGERYAPYGDRYLALTSLASIMTEKGRDSGAEVMLRVTANSVIRKYSELFHPEELEGCSVMIDYSEDNISRTMVAGDEEVILDDMDMYKKITAVYGELSGRCDGLKTYPMIDRGSLSADEFDEAVRALTAMGYEKYYVY